MAWSKRERRKKKEEEAESRSVVSPTSLGDIGEQRGHAEATRSISIMEGEMAHMTVRKEAREECGEQSVGKGARG